MPTRVFIGYGYSARDEWIEDYVFPIVKALGLQILHGKGMHGQQLQDGVKARIEQAAGVIGFCTLRGDTKRRNSILTRGSAKKWRMPWGSTCRSLKCAN